MKLNKTLLATIISGLLSSTNSYASSYYSPNYDKFLNAVKQSDYISARKYFNPKFVNVRDAYGRTPLHYSLANDNYEISALLMNNGAIPTVVSQDGRPAYCNARNSDNENIKRMFRSYSFENCYEKSFWETNTFRTGMVIATLGTIAALGGSGGGGGSSGDNGGGNGGNGPMTAEYGQVGEVDEILLNDILSSSEYNHGFTFDDKFYSNAGHFNEIRLPYSLVRGYTGKYSSSLETPAFMEDADVLATGLTGNVRVAVVDTGVQSANSSIQDSVITGLSNSNLAYLFCSENPADPKCSGATYAADDANPYENYDDDNSTWHGTAVAGIITGSLPVGVAPDADILPYRITFDDGGFVSNYYIGEAFKSAVADADAANNAVVINNSWGYPTAQEDGTPTLNAGDITSKNDLNTIFQDSTYGSNPNNFFDQMTDAVTNHDAIFVFATGNEGTSQPGVTTAIPLYFEEFQNADGSYKNFIAVTAYDTEAGTIASYSNKCGVAKQYCITAPGTDVLASIYESGNLSSDTLASVSGTSFAAPMVSAAAAVLKGAFPYLSGADITDLLFVTARDLGDAGVDDIYGWGMLDLERATRPVGAQLVPVDNRIDGRTYALNGSSLRLSHIIGNKIKEQNLKTVFIDSFNRTFDLNLSEKVEIIQEKPRLIDTFNRFASGNAKNINLDKNGDLSFYSSSHNVSANSSVSNEFKFSYNLNNKNNHNYGFNFYYGHNPYNSFIDNEYAFYNNYSLSMTSNYNILNPYFRNDSKENYAFNGRMFLDEKLSFNIGVLYQNYTPNTQRDDFAGIKQNDNGSSVSLVNSLIYSPAKNITAKAEFGLINEEESLFASRTSGAFGLGGNNRTYYFALQNDVDLYQDKLSFIGRANFGYTKVNLSDSSLISDVSDLYTNSFALGFNYNLENDTHRKSNISFLVAQSVKINSGNMSLRLPAARDSDGNISYGNYKINLEDKTNLEYQLSYNLETSNNDMFNAGVILGHDNYKDKNEGIFMLKYGKSF